MKNTLRLILALLLFLAAVGWSADADPEGPPITVSGHITDSTGSPIVGATVVLSVGDAVVTGTSTDSTGRYEITTADCAGLTLHVTSIAYADRVVAIDSVSNLDSTDVMLADRSHEINGISVSTPRQMDAEVAVGHEAIQSSSRRALVPTNPMVSLRQPQIAKVGSSHSSQIRVNGTSPNYSLNGIPIGRDPDHYGMFPIIPGTVVDGISFYPEGTPVKYRLPAIVDLQTPNRFSHDHGGEFDFSTVEVTGTYSYGTERFFVLGSARKSILDRLIKQFDISSDRQTLPPTNFRDIFFSSGVKLNQHLSLATDQYYVRDFLSYNTGQISSGSRNVQTYQHTDERYISTRMQALYPGVLLNASLATRISLKEYSATPLDYANADLVKLNLVEKKRGYVANFDGRFDFGDWEINAGSQAEYIGNREVTMSHMNWNFQPPFANSDKPFIYQQALNDEYASFSESSSELDGAAYLSAQRSLGRFDLRAGIRNDYYSSLSDRDALSLRGDLTARFSGNRRADLFVGTFSESPVNNILEPYQILVRAWLHDLNPIRHRVVRAGYSDGPFSFGLFQKSITNMPVVTPNFGSAISETGVVGSDFIRMSSTGQASFYGGTVSLDLPNVWKHIVSVYSSYAYTHAYLVDNGVTIPYELNATHRFTLELDAKASERWDFGLQLNVRSGYPYTPYSNASIGTGQSLYTESYYRSELEQENSSTFPMSATLNLSGAYSVGSTELFFAISNATNRGNPIINSASGYVYDTGILPSIGMRWRF